MPNQSALEHATSEDSQRVGDVIGRLQVKNH